MLQTCCHIYTQTRKYIRTKKKKNLAPYCLFLQLQQGADMKAQVLTTARRVHKHCRGSTNFCVHCTNITSVSLTSLCFPLNFLSHYYHRQSSPPSYSFMLASPFSKSPLILFLSPLFICVSSSSFLKRASKEDVLGSFYGNVPCGALS